MIKETIYTNADNESFRIEKYNDNSVLFEIVNNGASFYFLSRSEVDEFVAILNEMANEVWNP